SFWSRVDLLQQAPPPSAHVDAISVWHISGKTSQPRHFATYTRQAACTARNRIRTQSCPRLLPWPHASPSTSHPSELGTGNSMQKVLAHSEVPIATNQMLSRPTLPALDLQAWRVCRPCTNPPNRLHL